MTEQISGAEIKAMMEVQAKSTEQMVTIAGRLQLILEAQEKIVRIQEKQIEVVTISTPKEIVGSITKELKDKGDNCAECHKSLGEKVDKVIEKITWVQIIFGSIALITAIGIAISQIIHWTSHAGN